MFVTVVIGYFSQAQLETAITIKWAEVSSTRFLTQTKFLFSVDTITLFGFPAIAIDTWISPCYDTSEESK